MKKQEVAIRSYVDLEKAETKNITKYDIISYADKTFNIRIDPGVAHNVIAYIKVYKDVINGNI